MNRWFYIILFLLIVLICSADGCSENQVEAALREEQQTADLIDSVKLTFTADTPDPNDLAAYETAAIQKLTDLSDYLNTVSDTTLDRRIRQQAYEMILGLFSPEKSVFNYLSSVCPDLKPYPDDLADSSGPMSSLSCHIILSDIHVMENFSRQNDTTYTGTLSFSLAEVPVDKSQTDKDLSGSFIIEIFLVRKMKSFGSQQLSVWDTCLGDIGRNN